MKWYLPFGGALIINGARHPKKVGDLSFLPLRMKEDLDIYLEEI